MKAKVRSHAVGHAADRHGPGVVVEIIRDAMRAAAINMLQAGRTPMTAIEYRSAM